MKRVYLDSNVFISWINQEINGNLRPLFVEAELFFRKVEEEEHILVLSELFFEEVEKICYMAKKDVLYHLENKGVKTEQIWENANLSIEEFLKTGIHCIDALHAAIAIHFYCDCIVTFNIKDFQKISGKILVFRPAEF